MNSAEDTHRWVGFPIRKFTDQCLLAAPHDLSQRATSFIASQCQGIHQMPLIHLIHRQRSLAQGQAHRSVAPTKLQKVIHQSRLSVRRTASAKPGMVLGYTRPSSQCPRPLILSLRRRSTGDRISVSPVISSLRLVDRPLFALSPPQHQMVEAIGIEPTTSCLQSTRSPN
jgi:hypothetical protein